MDETNNNNLENSQFKASSLPAKEAPVKTENRGLNEFFGPKPGEDYGSSLILHAYFRKRGYRIPRDSAGLFDGMVDMVEFAVERDKEGLTRATGESLKFGLRSVDLAKARLKIEFLSPEEAETRLDSTAGRSSYEDELSKEVANLLQEKNITIRMNLLTPFNIAYSFNCNEDCITVGDNYEVIKSCVEQLNNEDLNNMLIQYDQGRQEVLDALYQQFPDLKAQVENYKPY